MLYRMIKYMLNRSKFMKHVNIGLLYEAAENLILFHYLELIISYDLLIIFYALCFLCIYNNS